jgi:hypothetical protein|tara:strand:- start:497 stop:781 length:285 start_codon:yes stop_codon:yes gene_type:complete
MTTKYNSPYEIGIGDIVIMTDEDGYKTDHLVLMNYIKGETDAKGYTPKTNRTILIDNYGKRTLVNDYRTMEVVNEVDSFIDLASDCLKIIKEVE